MLTHSVRSSGIGLAVVEALAEQGLNVVLVAIPNSLLETAVKTLSAKYQSQVGLHWLLLTIAGLFEGASHTAPSPSAGMKSCANGSARCVT